MWKKKENLQALILTEFLHGIKLSAINPIALRTGKTPVLAILSAIGFKTVYFWSKFY